MQKGGLHAEERGRVRRSTLPGRFHIDRVRLLFVFVVVAAVSCFGCTAVGPNFTRPPAPVAERWTEESGAATAAPQADYSRWWMVFNDPVLDSLIETARKRNPTLQTAGLRILEARAQLGIAVGNLYPQQQQVAGAYTYSQSSKHAANTISGDLNFQTYSYAFDAAWELDFWGKFRRIVESADASLTASVADYDSALVTLAGQVASTYTLIRIYQERLVVARENAAIQKSSFELADARYRNGAVTELDMQQAKSLLYDTEAQIPALEIGLKQAQHALSILLGMPPGDLNDLLGGSQGIPVPPVSVAVGIPAELIARRPDIRGAELVAAAQCAQIGAAKADLFPRIAISGSFGFLSSDSPLTRKGKSNFSDLFTWQSFTMSSGPSIEWPVLNYGRIKNNVRVQDARFQEALMNYRSTVLSAAREVEDALVSFIKNRDQVKLLTESVGAAKRAVDLSMIQYREGSIDYSRLLTAQQALLGEQDRLTQSRGAVTSGLVALYKALGGGWQPRLESDFVSEENISAMRGRTNWGDLLPYRELSTNLVPPPAAGTQDLLRRPDW